MSISLWPTRRVRALCAVLLFGWLALPLFASAQELHFLALQGEGTASVLIDKDAKFAMIADGGWHGERGIKGATIDSQHVLDYLTAQKVTQLVISCSHPDADHMHGLRELVQDARIRNFDVTFVDNGETSKSNPKLLYRIYAESLGLTPEQVKYRRAIDSNAFEGLGTPRLRVRNFVPAAVPKGDRRRAARRGHESALVVEYDIGQPNHTRVVVDFDDASESLVRSWALRNEAVANTLILPHHGSRKNAVTPYLGTLKERGLTDVIITVNLSNRYSHPDPDVLLALLETLGPDHVFVTGSQQSQNVTLTADGAISAETRSRGRAQLLALVEQRLASLKEAQHNPATAAAKTARHEQDLHDIEKSRDLLAGDRDNRDMVAVARAVGPGSESAPSPDPRPVQPGPAPDAPGLAEPGAPGPSGPASPSGDALSFAPDIPPSAGGGSGGWFDLISRPGALGTYYHRYTSEADLTFGGVIVGAAPRGPAVRSVEFVRDSGTATAYTLRFDVADVGVYDYTGVTALELWAAYNIVQPTRSLNERSHHQIPPNAAGLVGITDNGQGTGDWSFGIHPAIANSPLSLAGMRLDMFFSNASGAASSWLLRMPEYLQRIPFDRFQFQTYQWYDIPANIGVMHGQIGIYADSAPVDCLMRLRLITEYTQDVSEGESPPGDHTFDRFTGVVCRKFAPLAAIDRLAHVVALLNWVTRTTNQPLPPLPEAVLFPESQEIEPRMSMVSALDGVAERRTWLLVLIAIAMIAMVLALIPGFIFGVRRGVRWIRSR